MTTKNPDRRKRGIWRGLGLRLVFYYLLYASLAFFLQGHLLFPGQRRRAAPDAPWPVGRTEHWKIETEAARVPAALLTPQNVAPRIVVMVGHGNAELIEDWIDLAELLTGEGAAVLLVEFPGYGNAGGKPSRRTLDAVFLRAREMIEERSDLRHLPVVGLGRSIGSGPVCELARRKLLERVALMAPFDSLDSLVRRMALPARLLRSRYDNKQALREFEGPLWIIHGAKDRVIPAAHSHRLAADFPRAQLQITESGHNDLLWSGSEWWPGMMDFLFAGSLEE
ncbi:MAG TPA: hypothetical protein VMN36_02635 [Verrucomicrobiales bacterium]|nr:hypothetical protein [Verrucomicrobiales bacterium]